MGGPPRPPTSSDRVPAEARDRELEGLRAFWAILDAHFAEVMGAQRAAADETTATRAVISAIAPAEQPAVLASLRQAMGRALADGDWTEYTELQRARGSSYARGGLPVQSWYQVVVGLQHVIRPYLIEAYGADGDRLAAAYAGMTEFLTRTIALIADEFVETKEAIISTQDEELAVETAGRGQAENDYRPMFESHPQPLLSYDPEAMRILDVNDAAASLYGYPAAEFRDLTIPAIHPFESKEILADRVPNLRVSFRAGPWRHRKKDGTVFDVGSSSHEVVFKGRPARVVMTQDPSAQPPLDRDLRAA